MMDDATLIEGLNKSDRKAFERLYDKYVKMVFSFLISLLKDSQISEDLTQWCFMQLWEHRHEMSADRNVPPADCPVLLPLTAGWAGPGPLGQKDPWKDLRALLIFKL